MALPENFSKVDYHEGIVRTDCDCNGCGKKFIARINYDVDGDHRVICPSCGRQHYRTIQKGVVTEIRWAKYPDEKKYIEAPVERCWSSQDESVVTATPAQYIRKRFLRKEDEDEL